MNRLSFSSQFLIFSLIVVVAGMVTVGVWIQREVRQAVTNRTAGVTALYLNSFVLPHVQTLGESPRLDDAAVQEFDRLMVNSGLGRDIVAFKIWSTDRTILYSPNDEIIGRSFGPHTNLDRAINGDVVSHVSDLSEPENLNERMFWDSLIETYAPLRLEGGGDVVAVAEFYQRPDALLSEIRGAQIRSWLIVGAATLAMYLLLIGIVRGASKIMTSQREELEASVTRLKRLLTQNTKLHARMQEAAGRTTALNEQYLHRISADLHDGPAQDVALALLRLDSLGEDGNGEQQAPNGRVELEDLGMVRSALDSALADLRSIARGLRLPEIEHLTPYDTALRVIRDFERVTGTSVEFRRDSLPSVAPLPAKITLYRVLHEALANGYRHAPGASQVVVMSVEDDTLCLEVIDDGPGFDADDRVGDGALGIAGMRERVEMLGGRFEVMSGRHGTKIHACLPLAIQKADVD